MKPLNEHRTSYANNYHDKEHILENKINIKVNITVNQQSKSNSNQKEIKKTLENGKSVDHKLKNNTNYSNFSSPLTVKKPILSERKKEKNVKKPLNSLINKCNKRIKRKIW